MLAVNKREDDIRLSMPNPSDDSESQDSDVDSLLRTKIAIVTMICQPPLSPKLTKTRILRTAMETRIITTADKIQKTRMTSASLVQSWSEEKKLELGFVSASTG